MVVEISIGFIGLILFLCYLGWRLQKGVYRDEGSRRMARFAEIFLYSFSGLLGVSLLFVLMESSSAASYFTVMRVTFIVLMIILGLMAGVGGFVSSVYLVADGIGRMFNRGDKK